jgi:pilus assembly protein CpaB
MARAKGWIWISLALVCALSAGGLTYFLLQRQSTEAAQAVERARLEAAPLEETVSIPVAAADLERGSQLGAGSFELKEFPVSLAPSSALTDTGQLEGQFLSQFVAQGDIFRPEALYGGTGAPLSSSIEAGRTIIAFPIADLFTGIGLFVEGDRVDLLLSLAKAGDGSAEAAGSITGYTVQNVRIMRIVSPLPSEQDPDPAPTALLLELDPTDAVMVKKVKDSGGTIDLALRSPVDEDDFTVPPVTDDDLTRLMSGGGGAPNTVGNAP